ncbi:protein of unknown function [Acidithiobacillus ferrivorans]|uniref:Uncharacterized protein n=1 Tax=Acidithiobacillus ferrivorans TaxID=160808 RepID=A0A060URD1_9PROT|nr:hypothetical protein AFERRI_530077 [Acidithiobacillus ferrivorans]SMH67542.1 protein of unknown function [Acidithiobacillus ferrivorans]
MVTGGLGGTTGAVGNGVLAINGLGAGTCCTTGFGWGMG